MAGYKTYIVAALIGLVTAIKALGYIDESVYQTIIAILGSGGLITMRMALGNK